MKTKSKVKSACILLLLCTGILTMSGCSMGMGRETLENDVLRVGMHLDIDKMCYLSQEDNQPEGFEVELAGLLEYHTLRPYPAVSGSFFHRERIWRRGGYPDRSLYEKGKFSGRYAGRISGRTERRWKSFPAFHEIFRGRPYDIMVPGSKGLSPHELAHKWVKDLGIGPDDTDPLSSGNNF